jgi:hypothetical protein
MIVLDIVAERVAKRGSLTIKFGLSFLESSVFGNMVRLSPTGQCLLITRMVMAALHSKEAKWIL